MDARTIGLKFDEDSYIVSKYLSINYLLITKGKIVLLERINLEEITVTKQTKSTLPKMENTDTICFLSVTLKRAQPHTVLLPKGHHLSLTVKKHSMKKIMKKTHIDRHSTK